MKELISEYLHKAERKRIEMRAVEDYVMDKLAARDYSYRRFAQAVEELVRVEKLEPIKARGQNARVPELYNWYRIVSADQQLSEEEKQKLLTAYHPQLRMSYYFNHPQEYKRDQQYLEALDRFLKNSNSEEQVTVNERSFQIFKDEKLLSSPTGTKILRRVGLEWADLGCYPTYEPFFYYRRESRAAKQDVLIIENKDTFFSFKELMQEDKFSWGEIEVSWLIYGEGKKIQTSFSFFSELENYRAGDTAFNFYYFGDLDPAGLTIWWNLQQEYEVDFRPAEIFYRNLLARHQEQAPELTTQQKWNQQAIEEFAAYFSTDWAQQIKDLLAAGTYIPQEGLSYQVLREITTD